VLNPYLALLMSFGLCAFVAAAMVGMSWILGPRHPTQVKLEIFETGNPPLGSLRGVRFPIKFYLTAILFIVFDIEVVFMYPWAVIFRRLGWVGLAEMGVFIAILAVGLAYVWRVGALEWD
jgi:NADH-quinone oxidoreductase subunit A